MIHERVPAASCLRAARIRRVSGRNPSSSGGTNGAAVPVPSDRQVGSCIRSRNKAPRMARLRSLSSQYFLTPCWLSRDRRQHRRVSQPRQRCAHFRDPAQTPYIFCNRELRLNIIYQILRPPPETDEKTTVVDQTALVRKHTVS